MEWNEIIANILMAPINFVYWLIMLIADWWGIGVALTIATVSLWYMNSKK